MCSDQSTTTFKDFPKNKTDWKQASPHRTEPSDGHRELEFGQVHFYPSYSSPHKQQEPWVLFRVPLRYMDSFVWILKYLNIKRAQEKSLKWCKLFWVPQPRPRLANVMDSCYKCWMDICSGVTDPNNWEWLLRTLCGKDLRPDTEEGLLGWCINNSPLQETGLQ